MLLIRWPMVYDKYMGAPGSLDVFYAPWPCDASDTSPPEHAISSGAPHVTHREGVRGRNAPQGWTSESARFLTQSLLPSDLWIHCHPLRR